MQSITSSMYARELAKLLHGSLAEPAEFDETIKRFEALRSGGLLPRGRENAGVRLTDAQISSAVLGFVHSLPAWAGHASLVLGGLCAVGGPSASIRGANTLLDSIANILANDDTCKSIVTFTLSIQRGTKGDEYYGKAVVEDGAERRTVSYISHMALREQRAGAEKSYDHDRIYAPTARQLVLGREFFSKLRRDMILSRHLDLPLKTDWREYEREEERSAFYQRLGARANSCFLNLGVDTHVTWPNEPTVIQFGGHQFVAFPKTATSSQSISIDLINEKISTEDARTLISRFLSLLSWCESRHAFLNDGWSGNPVPVPVSKSQDVGSSTPHWVFSRNLPEDAELLQRLAYYREALNANRAGLVTFEVLSFYKVFEIRTNSKKGIGNPTKKWIRENFVEATKFTGKEIIHRFDSDRNETEIANYIYENCRVAVAHASAAAPSDADSSLELRRLYSAAEIIHALARHFIETEYKLSSNYYSGEYSAL